MSPAYREFVQGFESLLRRAARFPGVLPARRRPKADHGAPRALILAPHPDDECLTGILPWRLQHEQGWRVGVIPLTLGSRRERRAERLAELREACGYLNWDVLPFGGKDLASLLRRQAPRLVLFPHRQDAHPTHRGAHRLSVEALRALGSEFRCQVAETEYWSTLVDPNLMVAAPNTAVAELIEALSFYRGEIARNPYHVLFPCWLADSVRRGAELVGGQGAGAPRFRFGSLYRLSHWNGRALMRAGGPGRVVGSAPGALRTLFTAARMGAVTPVRSGSSRA